MKFEVIEGELSIYFIGGCIDGYKAAATKLVPKKYTHITNDGKKTTYRLVVYGSPQYLHRIYVDENIETEQVFPRLINGYISNLRLLYMENGDEKER